MLGMAQYEMGSKTRNWDMSDSDSEEEGEGPVERRSPLTARLVAHLPDRLTCTPASVVVCVGAAPCALGMAVLGAGEAAHVASVVFFSDDSDPQTEGDALDAAASVALPGDALVQDLATLDRHSLEVFRVDRDGGAHIVALCRGDFAGQKACGGVDVVWYDAAEALLGHLTLAEGAHEDPAVTRVTVLQSMVPTAFVSAADPHSRQTPASCLFRVATSAAGDAYAALAQPLPPPNMIDGLAAALLEHCERRAISASLVVTVDDGWRVRTESCVAYAPVLVALGVMGATEGAAGEAEVVARMCAPILATLRPSTRSSLYL